MNNQKEAISRPLLLAQSGGRCKRRVRLLFNTNRGVFVRIENAKVGLS